ncbi:MAG: branched-chain amino acid ABC transporter permease LivH [Pseudolabrys sp.]
MDYFLQQLINGVTLGAIYGLIAIGYTMVYGIIGMINFAHGDVFMVGAFIALIVFLGLLAIGITAVPLALFIVLLVAMALTALFIHGGYTLTEAGGFAVQLSNVQIMVVVTTVVLMAVFSWVVANTRLGRDMRACEQDLKMASLLGVDVDRTISYTFVIGAALATVAGIMHLLYYGVIDFFIGFVAGVKAFTAAVLGGIGSLPGAMLGGLLIGLIETFWSAYFSIEYKDVAAFSILVIVLIFLPTGILGRPEVEKV